MAHDSNNLTPSNRSCRGSLVGTAQSTRSNTTYILHSETPVPRLRPDSLDASARIQPQTSSKTIDAGEYQLVICAILESRGSLPGVGLAFLNIDSSEAILSQFSDSSTYLRTIQKLHLLVPCEVLVVECAGNLNESKLHTVLEAFAESVRCEIVQIGRRHFSETLGLEIVDSLALCGQAGIVKSAITGQEMAASCLAAVSTVVDGSPLSMLTVQTVHYAETHHATKFAAHALRIKYEPSEGAMLIDLPTVQSLELVQNLKDGRSRECLLGLLNETQTPMGARSLRNNVLQPLTTRQTIESRWDAVQELSSRDDIFRSVRRALAGLIDVDKLLSSFMTIHPLPTLEVIEQGLNNLIMLKQYLCCAQQLSIVLSNSSSAMLDAIREQLSLRELCTVETMIGAVINDDVHYSKNPLDLRYQRAFAIRSGVNGLLDAARTTFKEGSEDARSHMSNMSRVHELDLELKFDSRRQFYFRVPISSVDWRAMHKDFINIVSHRSFLEFSTLSLVKQNQKAGPARDAEPNSTNKIQILDAHNECIMMSDEIVGDLIERIRDHASALFKSSESIALLDVLTSFACLVVTQNYVRPEIGEVLAVRSGRHPIREKSSRDKFTPNDVYATRQRRFQVVTGCNMSGKSTYTRMIGLMMVMAQVGSFVPADYASFPIRHQLFARINADESLESNTSTFAAEMREAAYIVSEVCGTSAVIMDELGRGTSTRDGLAIALAIAESLARSGATVWFVTHHTEVGQALAERPGVSNLHMVVASSEAAVLKMLYQVSEGTAMTPSYGLCIARLVPLPQQILTHASKVSRRLARQHEERQVAGAAYEARRARHRLVLDLSERLQQALAGNMRGEQLRLHLAGLQAAATTTLGEAAEGQTAT